MIYRFGHKMSKSKGNVVSPDELVDRYGADSLRLYILFMGPADQDKEWQDKGVEGMWRFLARLVAGSCSEQVGRRPARRAAVEAADARSRGRRTRRSTRRATTSNAASSSTRPSRR